MKFTHSWLLDHLDTQASLPHLTDRLSMLGLVVDQVEDRGKILEPFLIAHILSCAPHPQADRLQVCQVTTGDRQFSVVCGAPNARAGLKTVLALEGMVIPATGLPLKKGVIRGVESQGMLCSAEELGLGFSSSSGILELPEDAPVGQPFAAALGYDDGVVEIEVTPNRGDCLGVRGVARDLAAAGLGTLKPLLKKAGPHLAGAGLFPSPVDVKISGPLGQKACPSYAGRLIRGVKNGPSPEWLQKRLHAIGVKSISALVDVTNYLCFDQGRPLHVFDKDGLSGSLTVRMAQEGEVLHALDEKEYALDEAMLVIADEKGPVALAGIMGGRDSGCSLETRDVFLESAFFDPVSIAQTGRRLGIQSDSRYRFERTVDPASVLQGLEQATALILELCGGEASQVIQVGEGVSPPSPFSFDLTRIQTLGGVCLPSEEILGRLSLLGCEYTLENGSRCSVVPPTWRSDLTQEADLVEEIVRLVGYDQIPSCPLPPASRVALAPALQRREVVRHTLAGRGLKESITWSFMKKELALQFGGGQPALTLTNPMSPELEVMRPSLLPNLLEGLIRNYDRGQENGAVFEIAPVYGGIDPQSQQYVACGVRSGLHHKDQWNVKGRVVDVFDAKADLAAALAACGVVVENLQLKAQAPDWYHPGRSGTLLQGQKVVGYFGEPHPRILAYLGAKSPLVVFELLLDDLPPFKGRKKKDPLILSSFQPVERDFAFVVAQSVSGDGVIRAVGKADKRLIKEVSLFDVFSFPPSETGEALKSIGIRVRLEPQDKTLTEEELTQLSEKIVTEVGKATGGVLRKAS